MADVHPADVQGVPTPADPLPLWGPLALTSAATLLPGPRPAAVDGAAAPLRHVARPEPADRPGVGLDGHGHRRSRIRFISRWMRASVTASGP